MYIPCLSSHCIPRLLPLQTSPHFRLRVLILDQAITYTIPHTNPSSPKSFFETDTCTSNKEPLYTYVRRVVDAAHSHNFYTHTQRIFGLHNFNTSHIILLKLLNLSGTPFPFFSAIIVTFSSVIMPHHHTFSCIMPHRNFSRVRFESFSLWVHISIFGARLISVISKKMYIMGDSTGD